MFLRPLCQFGEPGHPRIPSARSRFHLPFGQPPPRPPAPAPLATQTSPHHPHDRGGQPCAPGAQPHPWSLQTTDTVSFTAVPPSVLADPPVTPTRNGRALGTASPQSSTSSGATYAYAVVQTLAEAAVVQAARVHGYRLHELRDEALGKPGKLDAPNFASVDELVRDARHKTIDAMRDELSASLLSSIKLAISTHSQIPILRVPSSPGRRQVRVTR